jgi:hypothetical protein
LGHALSREGRGIAIRHQLIAIPVAIKEISGRIQMQPQDQTLLGCILSTWIPLDALITRFDEAVTLVAGMDPVLAFRMRSKDLGPVLLGRLRVLSLNDPTAASLWPKLEAQVVDQVVSDVKELIVKVAWTHGFKTWWKTPVRLRKPPPLDPRFLDLILAKFQEAVRSQAVQPGATVSTPPIR